MEWVSEYCFTSLSARSWQYRDRRKPEVGILLDFFFNKLQWFFIIVPSSAHRQHCTLHAFEQFGALYIHNPDDKYPTRQGFKPSTSEFRATTGPNEPAWPASWWSTFGCFHDFFRTNTLTARTRKAGTHSLKITYMSQPHCYYPVWLGCLTHLLREAQSDWPPFCFHSQLCKNDTRAAYQKTRMSWNWDEYFKGLRKLGYFQQT